MKDKNKLNAGYGFNRYMVECEFEQTRSRG